MPILMPMKVLKTNCGFSLVEAILSVGLLSGLGLMIGYGLASQKKQEVVMTSKLSLTSTIENVVGRLNSTSVMANKFNKIFESVIPEKGKPPTTPAQIAFSNCIQKQNAADCMNYEAFPDPPVVETVPVGQGINLVTRWTSAIQCETGFCGSYIVNIDVQLAGNTPAVESTEEFKAMKNQLAKMSVSKEREFPILTLVEKSDMSYQCVKDKKTGKPQLVVGLNSDDTTATCAEMSGNSSCEAAGMKPLKGFGGNLDAPLNERCEILVDVPSCTEGIGSGGFFDGSCQKSSRTELKSYIKTDPQTGRPISAVICGPGGECVNIGVATKYTGGMVDIEYELLNSNAYNQLMTTWKNEGTLVPAKNLGVDTIDPNAVTFDSILGGGIPGAPHLVISLLPKNYDPSESGTVIKEAFAAPGGNVNGMLFQQGALIVENPNSNVTPTSP